MEQYFKLGITVNGVKRRCRKSERHFISGGYLPYNNGIFNQEEVETLARGILETNMKRIDGRIKVVLNKVKVENGIQTIIIGSSVRPWEILSSLEKELA
jgi:hypothetical protein